MGNLLPGEYVARASKRIGEGVVFGLEVIDLERGKFFVAGGFSHGLRGLGPLDPR